MENLSIANCHVLKCKLYTSRYGVDCSGGVNNEVIPERYYVGSEYCNKSRDSHLCWFPPTEPLFAFRREHLFTKGKIVVDNGSRLFQLELMQ
jgi:hypothetical protein